MNQESQDISDTVKIERPMTCRRQQDRGGRVAQDSVGNTVTVRTRTHDSPGDLSLSLLELTDDLQSGTILRSNGTQL